MDWGLIFPFFSIIANINKVIVLVCQRPLKKYLKQKEKKKRRDKGKRLIACRSVYLNDSVSHVHARVRHFRQAPCQDASPAVNNPICGDWPSQTKPDSNPTPRSL